MPITLDGTNGITTPTYGGADTSEYLVPVTQFKNRIINGAMGIDQRNAGASVTPSSGAYTLDRWVVAASQTSKFSVQQNAGSVTPPTGFINYLGVTSLSAYSVGSTENFEIQQRIEGLNVTDLAWGTANAKTVTLSFWVRSSLTGTFGGFICNSATDYSYVFSYSISSANTWEQKSVTIAGPTSGTWLTTNGIGMFLGFSLGAGSSTVTTASSWNGTLYRGVTGQQQIVGTNGATFYITGCQLEIGSTATSFDYRPYGTELALCQRYYETFGRGIGGGATSTTQWIGAINYKVAKRASPTLATPSVVTIHEPSAGTFVQSSVSIAQQYTDIMSGQIILTNFSGLTAYRPSVTYEPTGGKIITADCEL